MPRHLPTLALAVLAFGAYVKGLPAVAGLGAGHATVVSALIVAVAVFVRILNPQQASGPLALVGVLALTFIPGTFVQNRNEYSLHKVSVELPLMLLCLCGGILLLRARRARRWWLTSVVVFGVLVAALALIFPNEIAAANGGALALEGSNTISTGRATGGAAVVVAALASSLAITRWRRAWLWGLALILGGFMLFSGSRGPTWAAITAVLLVATFAPGRRRGSRLLLTSFVIFAASWYAFSANLVSGRLTTISDTSAQTRRELWTLTTPLLWEQKAGVGWGKLGDYLPPGARLKGVGDRQYPHNLLLEVGAEGGLLALGALVLVLVVALRIQTRAAVTPIEAAMLGLLTFLILNSLVSGDVGDNRGLWATVGAALVASGNGPKVPLQAGRVPATVPGQPQRR